MTNKRKIALVLGAMCFALTAGICIQIKTVKNISSTISQNYKENSLRAEVLKYKEKYDNLLKETEEIDKELQQQIENATENNSELEEAKNQINEGKKIIGLTEVTGSGVIITVADGDIDLVHDSDILKIVNELKNAGAEAISINGQRVILTTSIICGGNIINMNGERIGSPFEIKAIGSPEALANLSRTGGWLSILKERGVKVSEPKKSNNITIPKYSGVLNFKYVSSAD